MIKHGPIHKTYGRTPSSGHSHLKPIRALITKGVADATENITLHPLACDVRGAKKFDVQRCVIARAINRTMKPQGVVVGRSMAFVVQDGLAIRFNVPAKSRESIDEFDLRGRVRRAPIELHKVTASQKLTTTHTEHTTPRPRDLGAEPRRKRMRKVGLRAVGGGRTTR